jgi:hypothetical protein
MTSVCLPSHGQVTIHSALQVVCIPVNIQLDMVNTLPKIDPNYKASNRFQTGMGGNTTVTYHR